MFDSANNTIKNKYDKDYLLSLDNDLENLKMSISDHDVYGNANLKEVPNINYKKLINSLSKLKIDVEHEDAEVIDELVENKKDEEIKVIDKNDTKKYGLDIDEFIKNTKKNNINLKIPDFNDINDSVLDKSKTSELLEMAELDKILSYSNNNQNEKNYVNKILNLAQNKKEEIDFKVPNFDNTVEPKESKKDKINNKMENLEINVDLIHDLNLENNDKKDHNDYNSEEITDICSLQIPNIDIELFDKNEENVITDEPKKIDIDKVLNNLRQKNEEKRKQNIPNMNWFEKLKVPSFDKNDILNNTLNKNDILIKKESVNNKQLLLKNKYKIDENKINEKAKRLQHVKPLEQKLQKTQSVNNNELNKVDNLTNNNIRSNDTINTKSFLQRIKNDNIYNVDE